MSPSSWACALVSAALGLSVSPSWAEDHGITVIRRGGGLEPDLIALPDAVPHTRPSAPVTGEEKADPASLEIVYTGDIWGNASGGVQRRARYLDNLDLLLSLDLEALAHVPHTTVFIYGLYNNGKPFSDGVVGDAQTVSNIETGVQAFRLYEAWIEHSFFKERASLRVGLYDYNSEFDALDSSALFINSSHGIGPDISQSGQNGPSIFPVTSLAARLDVKIADPWHLRLAVLDGVPGDPDRPKHTLVNLGGGDGVFLAAELEYKSDTTKVIGGYWHYTALFEDLLATAETGSSLSARGNKGGYVRAERKLYTEPQDNTQGLAAFVRTGWANTRFNSFKAFYGVGISYTGLLPGHTDDQLGLAIGWVQSSARARRVARLEGAVLRKQEVNLELTYRLPLTSWLTLQPDAQYIINPGLDPTLRNAFVLGFRFEIGHTF